jgi:hypothetical protein
VLGPGIELRRTSYDLTAAAERIRGTQYPGIPGYDVQRPPLESDMMKVFEAAALR